MNKRVLRPGVLALAVSLVAVPAPSQAIAPALLVLVKQIAQQTATSMIKDALLSSLSGMGCKGVALANALNAFDMRRAAGGAGMLAGMPKMTPGMALPQMPQLPQMPAGMTMPGMPAGAGLLMGGLPAGASIPPEIAARMTALMPGAGTMPAGMGLDADQMALLQRAQQAMSEPLSPPETVATIDELSELGFVPKAMQAELKECMVLVPGAVPALGMGMALMKPMIPQLRQARDSLHALPPAEQDEVAATLAQEVSALPADQRAALMEHLDSGFYPARISDAVKARAGSR